MVFPIPHEYKTAILRQYHKNISRYPIVYEEVEAFLQGKEESFSLCLQYLYGHMAAQDVLSNPPEMFAGYVRATLDALREIDYVKTVPPDVFFPYVLYPRVNSETLDGSRSFLMGELLPFVLGKSMEKAALSVNYWCYAHATYTPAGQEHLVGPGRLLRRAIEADRLTSSIFFGPPGCGKTTLASIIAGATKAAFVQLNAVTSGVGDVRDVIKSAQERRSMYGQPTYLLLDE